MPPQDNHIRKRFHLSPAPSLLRLCVLPGPRREHCLSPPLLCSFYSSPAVWTPRFVPHPGSSLVGGVSPNHCLIRGFLSPSREFPTSPPAASKALFLPEIKSSYATLALTMRTGLVINLYQFLVAALPSAEFAKLCHHTQHKALWG